MATSGKVIAGGIVAFGAVFGAGMWYAQVYAYYEEVTGIAEVTVGGETFAVTDYVGINAPTSPLKMRGCFNFEETGPIFTWRSIPMAARIAGDRSMRSTRGGISRDARTALCALNLPQTGPAGFTRRPWPPTHFINSDTPYTVPI